MELSAKGIITVNEQIDALKASTKSATDAAAAMNKVLQDPKNREAVRNLEMVRQANAGLIAVERQRAALANLSDRTYGRGALASIRQELDLKRQISKVEADYAAIRRAAAMADSRANGLADARERLKINQQMLRDERELARYKRVAQSQHDATPDGQKQLAAAARLTEYAQRKAALEAAAAKESALQGRLAQSAGAAGLAHAKERLRVAKVEADIAKNSHRADLNARYGNAGGRLAAAGESRAFGMGAGLAAGAAGGALAMAASGFQGTVEMQQFTTALSFASREMAGAFVPALKNLTALMNIARLLLSQMSGSQQEVLAKTALTVAGLGALNVALYRTTGVTLVGAAAAGARAATGGGGAAGVTGAGALAGAVPPGAKLPGSPAGLPGAKPPMSGKALNAAVKTADAAVANARIAYDAASAANSPGANAAWKTVDAAKEAAQKARFAQSAAQEAMAAGPAAAGAPLAKASRLGRFGSAAGKVAGKLPLLSLAYGAYEDNEEHGSLYGLSRQAGYSKVASSAKYLLGGAAGSVGLDNLTGTDSRLDLKRERSKLKPNEFTFDEEKDKTQKDRLYSLSRAAGYNKFASAGMMALGTVGELTGASVMGGGMDARGGLRQEGYEKRLADAYKLAKAGGLDRNAALTKSFGMVEGDAASRAKTIAGLAKTDPTWKSPDAKKPGDDAKTNVTPILPTLFSEAGSTYEEFALARANSAASKEGGEGSTIGDLYNLLVGRWGKEKPADKVIS
mgnify:CR=1 FL=1